MLYDLMILIKQQADVTYDEGDALSESFHFSLHFHDHCLDFFFLEDRQCFADVQCGDFLLGQAKQALAKRFQRRF